MIRIGVLHVYDPATGFPNIPVATLAWDERSEAVAVSWLPSQVARQARDTHAGDIDFGWVIEHLDPTTIWLEELGEGNPFDPLDIQASRAADKIIVAAF